MSKIEKTNEFNFKDFFLDEEEIKNPDEKEKSKRATAKPEVVYSVEWADHCDCIIKRTTKQTEKYLALLVSKGQYYIKDNNGNIEQLTLDNYVKFFDKLEDSVLTVDVNWVKHLPKGKRDNEHLIRILNDETFQILAKNNLIFANSLTNYSSYHKLSKFYLNHINILKKVKDLLCLDMTENDAKSLIREEISTGNRYYYRDRIVTIPSNLKDIVWICFDTDTITEGDYFKDEYGTDYNNYNLSWKISNNWSSDNKQFETSPIEIIYNTFGESGLFNLLNALREQGTIPNDYSYDSSRDFTDKFYQLLTNVDFKCEKFIEYIVYQPMIQGYTLNNLLQDWVDDLKMQLQIYGEIKEKYPVHLSSTHQKHSYSIEILEVIRRELEEKNKDIELKKRMEEIKSFCWKSDKEDYLITTPNSIEDVLQEARDMSNCLASYVNSIATGQTNVFFLRKKKSPDTPFVDVEVRGNKLRQAYCSHNRKPSKEVMEFIHRWCDKHKIEYTPVYCPQAN
jgi:hypothetical protein